MERKIDSYTRGYIDGYRDGLYESWSEIVDVTSRLRTPKEVQLHSKSKLATIDRIVDVKINELLKTPKESVFREPHEYRVERGVDSYIYKQMTPDEKLLSQIQGLTKAIIDDSPEYALKMFKNIVALGAKTLLITDMEPLLLELNYGYSKEKAEIIRITKDVKLEDLSERVSVFLEENETNRQDSGIFVDSLHKFLDYGVASEKIIGFVYWLREQVVKYRSRLIMVINKNCYEPMYFHRMKTGFDIVTRQK